MSEIENKWERAGDLFLMGFLIFVLFPIALFLIAFILPETHGWFRVGVVTLGILFIEVEFILLLICFRPRRPVEFFRRADGVICIPVMKVPAILGLINLGFIFVLVPIGAPLLLIFFGIAIVVTPEEMAPIMKGWSATNLFETFHHAEVLLPFMWVLIFTPLFLPTIFRTLKRQCKIVGRGGALIFDRYGLTIWLPERVHLPWDAIWDAQVRSLTGVLLSGDSRVDALRPTFHRFWPEEYRPEAMKSGILIGLDLFPVSARSVAEIIRMNICRAT